MPTPTSHDVFTSYAHPDEPLRAELDKHLALLRRKGIVRTWFDRDIAAGDNWRARIDEHLESADLILLLVSADFFASDYCFDVEMKRALDRRSAGEAAVVPIIARAVDVEDAPFRGLQWLPSGGKPVTSWGNRDEAWTDVVKGIRRSLAELEASPAWAQRRRAPDPTVAGAVVPNGPPPTSATPAPDPLDTVLDGFMQSVAAASASRGVASQSPEHVRQIGYDLAGIVEMKRVLWVDDVPTNNNAEIAALAALQIEVRSARTTEEGLTLLERTPEPFHLVISDWSRPGEGGTVPAGLRLLREMRRRAIRTPLVFYYGVLSEPLEKARRTVAITAGAQAATFVPGELLKAVREILS